MTDTMTAKDRCVHTRPQRQTLARKPTVFTLDVASGTWLRKSGTCAASLEVVSKRGVARSQRLGAIWRRWIRHQKVNVASLAVVASGSHVAPPDVASKRGVRRCRPTWRRWTRRPGVSGLPARVFRMYFQSSG